MTEEVFYAVHAEPIKGDLSKRGQSVVVGIRDVELGMWRLGDLKT
jgi:hypothetical protein